MGDVADMMLDGTLCQSCGAYVGNACGYPRDCSSCKGTQTSNKRRCKHCGKPLRGEQAMRDHIRAKHGPVQPASTEQLGKLQEKFNG